MDKEQRMILNAKNLKNLPIWRELIEDYLYNDIKARYASKIGISDDETKKANEALQAINWFQTWINSLANSSNDIGNLDSPNSNLIF